MEQTPHTSNTQMDGPISETQYTDPEVITLYSNGNISRAEADVYEIIAGFNDHGQGGVTCHN